MMNWLLEEIDEMVEENAEEMNWGLKARLTSFRERILAWGAEDEKVTRE